MYYHGSRAYVPDDRLDTMLTTRRLLVTGGLLAVVITIGVVASAIVGDSSFEIIVEKGTRAAVTDGKMSADHGHEKWAAVRKMDQRGLGATIGAHLRAGVLAGKMAAGHAREKQAAIRKMDKRDLGAAIGARPRTGVHAGKIGAAIGARLRRELPPMPVWAAVREMDKHDLGAAISARLRAGVLAGKITQEQADERLEAWKEKLKNPAEVLKAAVAAGKITQEQADERLRSMGEKPG